MPKTSKTPVRKVPACIICGQPVFDHWIPGDPHKIVLTSALVNTMKSDMLEDEFWDTIFQLADCKGLGKPFIKKPIIHWYRLNPPKEL